MKRKLTKFQQKKLNYNNQLKYTEKKIVCICTDVNRLYNVNDVDKLTECRSRLKNKKKILEMS